MNLIVGLVAVVFLDHSYISSTNNTYIHLAHLDSILSMKPRVKITKIFINHIENFSPNYFKCFHYLRIYKPNHIVVIHPMLKFGLMHYLKE